MSLSVEYAADVKKIRWRAVFFRCFLSSRALVLSLALSLNEGKQKHHIIIIITDGYYQRECREVGQQHRSSPAVWTPHSCKLQQFSKAQVEVGSVSPASGEGAPENKAGSIKKCSSQFGVGNLDRPAASPDRNTFQMNHNAESHRWPTPVADLASNLVAQWNEIPASSFQNHFTKKSET